MQKFLSLVFVICLIVGLQILVMIFGWGVHPQSWWWIIGGGVFGATILRALSDALQKDGNKKQV
jgi:uncharacterized membrane protein